MACLACRRGRFKHKSNGFIRHPTLKISFANLNLTCFIIKFPVIAQPICWSKFACNFLFRHTLDCLSSTAHRHPARFVSIDLPLPLYIPPIACAPVSPFFNPTFGFDHTCCASQTRIHAVFFNVLEFREKLQLVQHVKKGMLLSILLQDITPTLLVDR